MRRYLAVGIFTLLGSFAAQAADLIVADDATPIDTSLINNSIYVQLLGGATQAGPADSYNNDAFTGTIDIDAGSAIAATVGVVLFDGLSVEADLLHTNRVRSDFTEVTLDSTSFMGNIKYTANLTDMFSLYAAVGLGEINYETVDGLVVAHASGLGYQLIGGLDAKLTRNISAVAEYRYQNTFDRADVEEDSCCSFQIPTSTVLIGLKLAF